MLCRKEKRTRAKRMLIAWAGLGWKVAFLAPHRSRVPKFTTKTLKLMRVVVASMGRGFKAWWFDLPFPQIGSSGCIYSILNILLRSKEFVFNLNFFCNLRLFFERWCLVGPRYFNFILPPEQKGNFLHFYRNPYSPYMCRRVKLLYW